MLPPSLLTHPFLDAARLAQGPLGCGDAVGDTAVTLAEAPELSTHFLGKKVKMSWSEDMVRRSTDGLGSLARLHADERLPHRFVTASLRISTLPQLPK